MKKRFTLTPRQLALAAVFLLIFTCMTIFLFAYRRDEKRFTHITTTLFTGEMKSNTLNMHYTLADPENFGIYNYEPILSCYDRSSYLESQTALEDMLADLSSIHTEKLTDADSYLLTLLSRSLENSLEMSGYTYYSEPLSPSSGMQTQLPILLSEYTFRSRRDVEDYLALLDQTDEYFASLLVFEQEKAAADLLMPAVFLQEVREQCDTIVTKEVLDTGTHFLQATFRERLELLYQAKEVTAKDVEKYLAENDRLLKTVLLPAYDALGDGLLLLEDETILPTGLAAFPDGKAYYELLLISSTGSYRSPEDILELLTAQFTKEYDTIKQLVSEHPEISEYLKSESRPSFPYPEAEHMLLDLQKRMRDNFPSLPEGSTRVSLKSVSSSLEEYCAPAFYLTTPFDDTDSNTIYINRLKTPDGLDLYTTLAHEGYPGHLYQNVYYNRSSYLSEERPARQLLWYSGYLEGWAVYVEFMAFDYAAELLTEHSQDTAALIAQLEKHNRSLQLCLYSILDIMIHYDGATYSQVAKLLEGFGVADAAAAKDIYHYIVQEPCNYLKYYLGYLEILSLQEKAIRLWGEDYTDYRFHAFYLDCGPSDFTSIEERLQETSAATGRDS